MKRRRLFNISKSAKTIAIISALITLVEGILWYFLPIYFEDQLNSVFLASVVISSYSLACLISSIPSGDIVDKVGRKFSFVLGIVGFIITTLFLFIGDFIFLVLFMALFGVFSTLYDAAAVAGILDHSRKSNVAETMGIADALKNSGWVFGPLIAGALMLYFEVPIIISIVILLLLIVSYYSLSSFPEIGFKFRLSDFRKAEVSLLRDEVYWGELKRLVKLGRPLLAILLFWFALGYFEYSIYTFEPIWTNSIGAGILIGAFILALVNLPYLLFNAFIGKYANRIGSRKTFFLGVVFIVLGQSFFLIDQSLISLALSIFITPVGITFLWVLIAVYIKKHVKKACTEK